MNPVPDFSRLLQSYFLERLMNQQQASPHTIAGHRDTFRLLIAFVQQHLGILPQKLALRDLDASVILAFLDHLERQRENSARSRNVRLAALRAFYRYIAVTEPSLGAVAQRVLAIPNKRYVREEVAYLTTPEAEALLATPDCSTRTGRRDHALLLVTLQTGLRVSEIIGLCWNAVVLDHGACLRCHGKGRKQRCTPLRKDSVKVLQAWARECPADPQTPVFPNARGGPLSRDGVAYIVAKHTAKARLRCPSLKNKRISPHVLRHTTAMDLLQHGVDRAVIALWLGHESVNTTDVYLHANIKMKEQALEKCSPTHVKNSRYKPSQPIMAFLNSL